MIYTCRESCFAASHFDTNHLHHVLWEPEDLDGAVARLKATIRFTIPEAKQQDD